MVQVSKISLNPALSGAKTEAVSVEGIKPEAQPAKPKTVENGDATANGHHPPVTPVSKPVSKPVSEPVKPAPAADLSVRFTCMKS